MLPDSGRPRRSCTQKRSQHQNSKQETASPPESTIFNHRKNALYRRAAELHELCGVEVAIIVLNGPGQTQQLTQFTSSSMRKILNSYVQLCQHPHECHNVHSIRTKITETRQMSSLKDCNAGFGHMKQPGAVPSPSKRKHQILPSVEVSLAQALIDLKNPAEKQESGSQGSKDSICSTRKMSTGQSQSDEVGKKLDGSTTPQIGKRESNSREIDISTPLKQKQKLLPSSMDVSLLGC